MRLKIAAGLVVAAILALGLAASPVAAQTVESGTLTSGTLTSGTLTSGTLTLNANSTREVAPRPAAQGAEWRYDGFYSYFTCLVKMAARSTTNQVEGCYLENGWGYYYWYLVP
jgi:hypothetical protein